MKGRHNDFCLLMQSSGRVEPCRSLRGRSDPLTSRRPVKHRTTEEVSSQVDRQVCLTQIPSGRKAGIVDRKGSRARVLPWSPPLQQPGLGERAGWRRRRTGESDIGNGAGTIREQFQNLFPFLVLPNSSKSRRRAKALLVVQSSISRLRFQGIVGQGRRFRSAPFGLRWLDRCADNIP